MRFLSKFCNIQELQDIQSVIKSVLDRLQIRITMKSLKFFKNMLHVVIEYIYYIGSGVHLKQYLFDKSMWKLECNLETLILVCTFCIQSGQKFESNWVFKNSRKFTNRLFVYSVRLEFCWIWKQKLRYKWNTLDVLFWTDLYLSTKVLWLLSVVLSNHVLKVDIFKLLDRLSNRLQESAR